MKILFVNPSAEIGGGQVISNMIAERISSQFELYSWFPSSGPAANIQNSNIKIIIGKSVLELAKFIKKEKFDVIHAHGTRAAFWVKIAFALGSPKTYFIYTLHGIHFLKKPFWYRIPWLLIEKLSNYFVNALVCVGSSDYKSAKLNRLININKLHLIENGIDVKKYNQRLHFDSDILKIFTACRLEQPKDVSTLIKAVSNINRARLIIAGNGSLRADLEKEAELLKAPVDFLGYRSDLVNIMFSSDIFILSSKWEGLPVAILEAMASGLPVIGSNVDGIRDIIQENSNGFLFNLGDINELSNKIELLRDANLRNKMGNEGRTLVASRFSAEVMVNKYKALYENSRGK